MGLWGVPQRRKRFIAIAFKDMDAPLLLTPNRTTYWYEAIADLIPTLADSQLTNTQIDLLHPKTQAAIARGEIVLLKRNQIRNYTPASGVSNPYCWTVTATLATDQRFCDRKLFADIVTPDGIYSLNTRCLARLQTIPATYKLSDALWVLGKTAIDGGAIGAGVPPLFAQQMFTQIKNYMNTSNEFRIHKGLVRMYSEI